MNQRQAQDLIYMMLFNADTAALRIRFNLPPVEDANDDRERDFMGIEALQVLANIEDALASIIASKMSPKDIKNKIIRVTYAFGLPAKFLAKQRRVSFLTGQLLTPSN